MVLESIQRQSRPCWGRTEVEQREGIVTDFAVYSYTIKQHLLLDILTLPYFDAVTLNMRINMCLATTIMFVSPNVVNFHD